MQFGAPKNSAIYELKSQYEAADADARVAYKAFSDARDAAAKKHGAEALVSDAAVLAPIRKLSDNYDAKAARALDLKDRLLATLDRGASGPPAGMDGIPSIGKAWLDGVGQKALDGTGGGSLVPAFYSPEITDLPIGALFVRSLIPSYQIDGDKVDYVVQTVNTNNAAPVAAGATKPTSVYTVAKQTADVVVVATVSEPVDRSLLMDSQAVADFLDRTMRMSVLLATENEIVNGPSNAAGFDGIVNTPGVLAPVTSGSLADQLYSGLTAVRGSFFEPDGIVINPEDLEEIRLEKASTAGTYLTAGVVEGDPDRIWGKRVVGSPVVPVGTAIVGAFGVGARIYDREADRVTFSESGDRGDGQELFTHNQIRFRAETRVTLAVTSPQAFAVLDLGTAT